MSTLISLARGGGHLAFDESPRVALKVFGARLALFAICVVVVGGVVILAGAVPWSDAVFVVALVGQALYIGYLLLGMRRDRAFFSMALGSPKRDSDKAKRQVWEQLATVAAGGALHLNIKVGERQIRQQLRDHLDDFDKHDLQLIASSLLAETEDRVDVDEEASKAS
jgi:hypothetical protein